MERPEVTTITRPELRAKINRDDAFTLLEVLPAASYRAGHLPGARHLPPDGVRATAGGLVPNRATEVIVYCGGPTCGASERAAHLLTRLGYSAVRRYVGGKADWKAAGLPLEVTSGMPEVFSASAP